MATFNDQKKPKKHRSRRVKWIVFFEVLILLILVGAYQIFTYMTKDHGGNSKPDTQDQTDNNSDDQNSNDGKDDNTLTPEQLEAQKEQERLKKEEQERKDLIAQADRLALSYDYDGAIKLIQSYKGKDGDYSVYPILTAAITGYETTKSTLVLYGGSYNSVTQFNHVFFHTLIADNSKAFDGDSKEKGYNMYMTTISEFNKMMQKMYDDGYVLVNLHDIAKKVTLEDGTTKFEAQEIYLPKGKKPFVLSQDDVSYYPYMDGDGFASRIVLDKDGKPTCEMKQDDGTVTTGAFDMVPLIDEFVAKHPDFSYKGAKGLIALTGYEGILGYRTNDPKSPTYEQDKKDAKAVVDAMKAEGWEFGSHGWGHKNSMEITTKVFETDSKRWLDEVEPLTGPTDIYVFPFGVDFETTMGHYTSDKFKYLKKNGFDFFIGVFKDPWMQIKDDYVRMTRRPLDGQAMLQFPERLADLFDVKEIIDPQRPAREW